MDARHKGLHRQLEGIRIDVRRTADHHVVEVDVRDRNHGQEDPARKPRTENFRDRNAPAARAGIAPEVTPGPPRDALEQEGRHYGRPR